MDYKKIFIKDACPTSIGGQAIMEGVMMRGTDRTAIAMRLPSGEIYLRTKKLVPPGKANKIPLVRGVVSFVQSLRVGMGTLMESADILEQYIPEEEREKPGKFEQKLTAKYGEKAVWNLMLVFAVVLAIVISIAGFILFPTVAMGWLGRWIKNSVVLNLIEGAFRILIFVLYVKAISKTADIKRLFQYHGAEHKTIHCFENGLELTPENAQQFYRLHPRCGTSFLMFVMIISLLLFSLLGWPNIWLRIGSRILLIPVIAGISYELLKWAGRSDNVVVRILSWPGLMMQKLTTADPDREQLEVAIVSLKAVLAGEDAPLYEGIVDTDAKPVRKPAAMKTERPVLTMRPAGQEDRGTAGSREVVGYEGGFTGKVSAGHKAPRYDNDIASVENLIRWGQQCLSMVENGRQEAVEIFCYVTGYTRADIIVHQKEIMDEANREEYERCVDRRLTGTPLQYITGAQEFMGLMFRVSPDVLIPRLDTEILAEQSIGLIRARELEAPKIADICTGSGALGITMAHEFPKAEVTMTDISPAAVSMAVSNAQLNGVFGQCIFLTGDLFDALPEGKEYDLIVCNPPYIATGVIPTLDREVKDHEPLLALDGGEDGLVFYWRIAQEAHEHLAPGGYLALEIGADQGEAVRKMLTESGHYRNVAVLQDLNHLDRVIITERRAESAADVSELKLPQGPDRV
ncbi:MAG: peptide chain release factor N(5)-glutamine methyltransferase [Mogibacterium sp.]|nr:peptide chain release factor N(5)-glutamine methyltransferase [Mogibacterium sp.]